MTTLQFAICQKQLDEKWVMLQDPPTLCYTSEDPSKVSADPHPHPLGHRATAPFESSRRDGSAEPPRCLYPLPLRCLYPLPLVIAENA